MQRSGKRLPVTRRHVVRRVLLLPTKHTMADDSHGVDNMAFVSEFDCFHSLSSSTSSSPSSSSASSASSCQEFPQDYGLSRPTGADEVALVWQNVHFRSADRHIIQGITGDLLAGQLKAIIGPSGVGKSTLLKIITGRLRQGVTGRVYLRNGRRLIGSHDDLGSAFTVAYIPQEDHHYQRLTVRETLLIASRIKNGALFERRSAQHSALSASRSSSLESIESAVWNDSGGHGSNHHASDDAGHAALVNRIVCDLLLSNCVDTPVKQCSGGQLKRLSIAVELLNEPQMLILDEPTTGLDFVAALQTIRVLQNLIRAPFASSTSPDPARLRRTAILCTIHQPSSSILAMFTHLYVIGVGGRALYHGNCDALIHFFGRYQLHCPPTYNPADFALQVAYGHHGSDSLAALADSLNAAQRSLLRRSIRPPSAVDPDDAYVEIERMSLAYDASRDVLMSIQFEKQRSTPSGGDRLWAHAGWLAWRTALNYSRDPVLVCFSVLHYVLGALLTGGSFSDHVGESDGCWQHRRLNNVTLDELSRELSRLTDNGTLFMFSGIHLTYMCVMFPVVQLQAQLPILVREQLNSWYSLGSFCLAAILVHFVHLMLVQLLYVSILYPLSGQPSSYGPYGIWLASSSLLGSLNLLVGLIMGAIIVHDPFLAILVALCLLAPTFPVTFAFVHDRSKSWIADAMQPISYQNHYLHVTMQSVYGGNRCEHAPIPTPNRTTDGDTRLWQELDRDFDRSFVLRLFDFESGESWVGWTFNSVAVFVLFVSYYLAMQWRLRKSAAL